MRAHLVQLDVAWEAPRANFGRVADLLARATVGRGDLVVLPEMFDTGFSLNIERTSDAGATLEFLTGLARDRALYVQGGRTVREGGSPRATNRAPVIGPDGRLIAEYAKIHPFSYGREPERFDGGAEVATYRWGRDEQVSRCEGEQVMAPATDSPAHLLTSSPAHASSSHPLTPSPLHPLTVCPAICYDLRFPELFRIGMLRGAEVFAIGANWPEARQAHWRALLIARAIENQAFVLGVNRTGRDPNLAYAGGSIGLGPRGEVLGELGPEEGVLSIDVDPRDVLAWREKFPAWRDARLITR